MCQTRKPRCSAWGQRGLCDAGLCGLQWVRACVWTAIRSCECRRPQFDSWVREIPWRRDRLPTPVFLGFPGGSDGKESYSNVGDLGLIPGVGKIPWRRAWEPTPVFLPGESPWTEEPGWLQSLGLQRIGHDWVTKHTAHLVTWWLNDLRLLFLPVITLVLSEQDKWNCSYPGAYQIILFGE